MLSYQKNGDCTMLDNVVVAALSLGYRYLDRENGVFAKPIGWSLLVIRSKHYEEECTIECLFKGTKEIVCWSRDTLYNEAEYLNLTVDELKARIEEFEATHTYLSLTPHDFSFISLTEILSNEIN